MTDSVSSLQKELDTCKEVLDNAKGDGYGPFLKWSEIQTMKESLDRAQNLTKELQK